MVSIIDFKAAQKWYKVPKYMQTAPVDVTAEN